jgi:hypothetical protein
MITIKFEALDYSLGAKIDIVEVVHSFSILFNVYHLLCFKLLRGYFISARCILFLYSSVLSIEPQRHRDDYHV